MADALAKVLNLDLVSSGPVKPGRPGKRGRPPKRKHGAEKRKGKQTGRDTGRKAHSQRGQAMTTEERLAKVERDLAATRRQAGWMPVGLVLGLGIMALAWVEVRALVNEDADGPGLVLYDAAGEPRAMLAADTDGLWLKDAAGKPRASLNTTADGPGLVLADAAGEVRVMLDVDAEGPGLILYDAAGKPRASLNVTADGPVLVLLDAAGKMIWSAP